MGAVSEKLNELCRELNAIAEVIADEAKAMADAQKRFESKKPAKERATPEA